MPRRQFHRLMAYSCRQSQFLRWVYPQIQCQSCDQSLIAGQRNPQKRQKEAYLIVVYFGASKNTPPSVVTKWSMDRSWQGFNECKNVEFFCWTHVSYCDTNAVYKHKYGATTRIKQLRDDLTYSELIFFVGMSGDYLLLLQMHCIRLMLSVPESPLNIFEFSPVNICKT